jgi:hypothetical protein
MREGIPHPRRGERRSLRQVENSTGIIESIARTALGYRRF